MNYIDNKNWDESYIVERQRGVRRRALTWNSIVWEVKNIIGDKNGEKWLENMKDLLEHPFFQRDPILVDVEEIVIKRMMKHFPHCVGQTWASPHPEAWCKLEYYQIWSPDLTVREVYGENEVRNILFK